MHYSQLPLYLSFIAFIIAFIVGLCYMCAKYVKVREEIDRD